MHPEAPRNGHIQKKCTICNACNVCNVCPIELMYIPRTPPQYALHRGVSQPPVFSKKNAPFRRQTCGTSTNVLKIRSVSDTFENGKKVHPEAPRSGHIQKKCTVCNACNVCPIEFMSNPRTPPTICYTQRGVTTIRD